MLYWFQCEKVHFYWTSKHHHVFSQMIRAIEGAVWLCIERRWSRSQSMREDFLMSFLLGKELTPLCLRTLQKINHNIYPNKWSCILVAINLFRIPTSLLGTSSQWETMLFVCCKCVLVCWWCLIFSMFKGIRIYKQYMHGTYGVSLGKKCVYVK